jgi:predicted Zn-dependent protease
MTMNGHFAAAGEAGAQDYEHGVQVIDEDKVFKYASFCPSKQSIRLTRL